jgi:hypothetical protein
MDSISAIHREGITTMSYDRAAAPEYAPTGVHYPAADVAATAVYAVTPPSVQRPKRTISTRVAAIIAAVAFVVGAAVAILVGMIVGPGGAGGPGGPPGVSTSQNGGTGTGTAGSGSGTSSGASA